MTGLAELARRAPFWLLPRLLAPLGALERPRLARVRGEAPISPPPTFIVGAPRTGSTLLYQVLTNTFEVAYISNLAAYFHHALWLGLRLHDRRFGTRPHGSFESRHGRTRGLIAPSETGKFWYRFFPRDRDFVAAGEVPFERLDPLRRTVAAAVEDLKRPIVFKNLNNGQRLQALREAFPEALVVFVRRDPLATARSLAVARRRANGTLDAWFSVRPRDWKALLALPWPEQVVAQVRSIERQIEEDLGRFPPGRVLTVRYESLLRDPAAEIDRVAAFYAGNGVLLGRREGASLPRIRSAEGSGGLTEEEEARLTAAAIALLPAEAAARGEPA